MGHQDIAWQCLGAVQQWALVWVFLHSTTSSFNTGNKWDNGTMTVKHDSAFFFSIFDLSHPPHSCSIIIITFSFRPPHWQYYFRWDQHLSGSMKPVIIQSCMTLSLCASMESISRRVERSPRLSINDSLELQTGIGLIHIYGHKDSCLPDFSPIYIPGAKQVDGEIIETLWAPINDISRSIQGIVIFGVLVYL